ncbi:MAG: HesB/IscA family protein [Rhodothalassiaceae bacterium]
MTPEFHITEKAAERIRRLVERHDGPVAGLRLYTKAAGCSGLMYRIDFAESPRPEDAVLEVAGTKLFIDRASLPYLKGARMDFKEDRFETGFVFENPNAKALCGCGESFMVDDMAADGTAR